MRATPFAARNVLGDAETLEVNGFAAPLEVTGFDDEYRAIREGAALYDFSMLHKFDVRGPAALELVDAMVVRDLSQLAVGRIAYGPIVDADGGMLDDATVMRLADDHVRICGGGGLPGAVEDCLEGRVAVEPLREQIAQLTLQGPASRAVLSRVADRDLTNEAFPYYTARDGVSVAGIEAMVARLGFSGELGYEVWVPVERAIELWDALVEAGEGVHLRAAGALAILSARTEAGMVMGDGLDYGPGTSPWECGLGWCVSETKRGYRGRDALLAARATAANRLVSVRLDREPAADATLAPVERDGVTVGRLGLPSPSPLLAAVLSLASLHRDAAEIGSRVDVVIDDERIGADVLATPVHDPERRRVRS
jgi:aminomethyltransferase